MIFCLSGVCVCVCQSLTVDGYMLRVTASGPVTDREMGRERDA
jgi:hypothetical protein